MSSNYNDSLNTAFFQYLEDPSWIRIGNGELRSKTSHLFTALTDSSQITLDKEVQFLLLKTRNVTSKDT